MLEQIYQTRHNNGDSRKAFPVTIILQDVMCFTFLLSTIMFCICLFVKINDKEWVDYAIMLPTMTSLKENPRFY